MNRLSHMVLRPFMLAWYTALFIGVAGVIVERYLAYNSYPYYFKVSLTGGINTWGVQRHK